VRSRRARSPLLVRVLVGLLAGGLAAVLAAVLAGCSGNFRQPAVTTLRIASYDFSENQILASVYAEGLRREGVPVSLQTGVGTREVIEPALEQGVVDMVIDYQGTALDFVSPGPHPDLTTPEQLHAALRQAFARRGIAVLDAAAAEDQNGFAVTTPFAAAHRLSRLSDLAPLAGRLTFGGPPECLERPLCLPGLRQVYGLRFRAVRTMSSRAATVEALVAGQIQVGLLETTDARLADEGIRLLADDRGLQPHENVVPLVRTAVLARRWGARLQAVLNSITARLTTADLVGLNRAVEIHGETPARAAARWWDDGA
jgi:osmoprotectant transport system substrate-binding protein